VCVCVCVRARARAERADFVLPERVRFVSLNETMIP